MCQALEDFEEGASKIMLPTGGFYLAILSRPLDFGIGIVRGIIGCGA